MGDESDTERNSEVVEVEEATEVGREGELEGDGSADEWAVVPEGEVESGWEEDAGMDEAVPDIRKVEYGGRGIDTGVDAVWPPLGEKGGRGIEGDSGGKNWPLEDETDGLVTTPPLVACCRVR